MTPPPAVLAPSVALERLEDEWRERAKQYYGTRTIGRDVLTNCADELATLRAGLAQQGEAVAWMVESSPSGRVASVREVWLTPPESDHMRQNFTITPLFTAPAAVDEAMVERAIVAGMATRPREHPPNWPGDYDADEQEHGRNFMRAALTAALQPAATSEGGNNV